MATHSSILAWEIPWTEEPGQLPSMELPELVGHDLATQRQQTSKGYMYQSQTPGSSHPTPFPLDIHMFVLYLCVSVSALQMRSSIPLF